MVYSRIENLFLWNSLEKSGFAVHECTGLLEKWNVGILKTCVWWNRICLYGIVRVQKNKIRPISAFY
jgi:hypothetical protein